jgi:hypothetical protein
MALGWIGSTMAFSAVVIPAKANKRKRQRPIDPQFSHQNVGNDGAFLLCWGAVRATLRSPRGFGDLRVLSEKPPPLERGRL